MEDLEDTLSSSFEDERNLLKISSFMSIAVRSCVEDALDQLLILRGIYNRNTERFTKDILKYKTLKERFTGLEDYTNSRLVNVECNSDKIAGDTNNLINALRESATEIRFMDTYTTLEQYTRALNSMANDDKWLLANVVKNEKEIKKLKQQYEDDRKLGLERIENAMTDIQNIKFAIDNDTAYGHLENKYFRKWEATRNEQNDMICKEKERSHIKIIQATRENLNNEIHAHEKYSDYIEENRNDMVNEINYWVKKYDTELEAKETAIVKLKTDLERLETLHQETLEKNEKRQREMAVWKQYKKEREIKRKRAKIEKWASMIIQAWWRGIMVRKHLGPYKGKKGKGKGKNNKKRIK